MPLLLRRSVGDDVNAADAVLFWRSVHDPVQCGLELRQTFTDLTSLRSEAARLVGELEIAPAFVIASVREDVATPNAASSMRPRPNSHAPRLCIAVDAEIAPRWALRPAVEAAAFGMMLTGVDVDTSLRALGMEGVEALRFAERFVIAAARDLRTRCLLEATLRLARDLGVPTLAPKVSQLSELTLDFDYVSVPHTHPKLALER